MAEESHSHKRADIQGLRALAVTMVILYHAGLPITGGFLGVDVFFVISGYVITEMLVREWARHGKIRLGRFYFRRFKRLAPALATMVGVTGIFTLLFMGEGVLRDTALLTGAASVVWSANVAIELTTGDYFDAPAATNPFLHTWSLAVEEQFYVFFPLLLAILLGRGRQQLVWIGVGLATLISFVLMQVGSMDLPVGGALLGFYSPLPRAWEFGVGALVALSKDQVRWHWLLLSVLKSVSLVALLAYVTWLPFSPEEFSQAVIFPVLATAILLVPSPGTPAFAERVLSHGALSRVGDWSYSLYLWHWPPLVFASFVWPVNPWATAIALLVGIVLAIAQYSLIENPLRHREFSSPRSQALFVAGTLGAPLLALGAVKTVAPLVSPPQSEVAREEDPFRGCLLSDQFDQDYLDRCSFQAESPGVPLYLLGDSNAAQLDDAVLAAADELGRPTLILSSPGCTMVEGFEVLNRANNPAFPDCSAVVSPILAYLDAAPPGTVILAHNYDHFHEEHRRYQFEGSLGSDPVSKTLLLRSALSDTVSRLRATGHDVILVAPLPTWEEPAPGWDPRLCGWATIALRGSCTTTLPEDFVLGRVDAVNDILLELDQEDGVDSIDFRSRYCVEGSCTPTPNGVIAFNDADHISSEESRLLAADLIPLLR